MPTATNTAVLTSGVDIPHNIAEAFSRHVELHEAILLREVGKPLLQSDEALNDSDKTLIVPAKVNWEILSIWVELVTSATVGVRRLAVEFQDDSADVIATVLAGATQAASLTRNYLVSPGAADATAFVANSVLTINIPKLVLPENYVVRVFDAGVIDPTADDMVVQMLTDERAEI